MIRVYSATFSGWYLGGDAIVIALDKADAIMRLRKKLADIDLLKDNEDIDDRCLTEIVLTPGVTVLDDGNY